MSTVSGWPSMVQPLAHESNLTTSPPTRGRRRRRQQRAMAMQAVARTG
jgi:hypothetical protein